MADYPVILVVSMRAKPGHAEDMRAALMVIGEASRAENGCEIYQLLQDGADPERFLLIERWRDKAAFKAHQNASHLAQGFATLEPLQLHAPEFAPWRAVN